MSLFTSIRDSVTGAAKDVANVGSGLIGGPLGFLTGGLTSPLGGQGAITGLMGLLGGGAMGGGGMGGFGGSTGSFGTTSNLTGTVQPNSLMDMLGQQYQTGPVSQTGTMNLNSQGLT
jgi:hypothetical protein